LSTQPLKTGFKFTMLSVNNIAEITQHMTQCHLKGILSVTTWRLGKPILLTTESQYHATW